MRSKIRAVVIVLTLAFMSWIAMAIGDVLNAGVTVNDAIANDATVNDAIPQFPPVALTVGSAMAVMFLIQQRKKEE